MMRPIKAVGIGAAAALAALLICAPVATAAEQHHGLGHGLGQGAGQGAGLGQGKGEHKVLKLVAKQTQQSFVQQKPNAFTQGDLQVFAEDLFDEQGKKVGTDSGECVLTRTADGGEANCSVTLQLAEGQITLAGLIRGFLNNGPFEFDQAITGGTGHFDKARGMLHGEAVSPTDTNLTIDLDH